ncbi:MAG: hypothetical protein DRQ42_05830 [Gammaproteobacteria bacterium]|nr:MAG: hypothetical protein DRQ42_05830 [Gammaproteobacteria bacterium]
MGNQHNPNVGENQSHYSGGGKAGGIPSAGVGSGLSSAAPMSVKNCENISQNQRPKARREKAGSFNIGT